MQSKYENRFMTKFVIIYEKLMGKQQELTLNMVTRGVQIPKYWPKIMPNIGIMQITSQFGPFDNTK